MIVQRDGSTSVHGSSESQIKPQMQIRTEDQLRKGDSGPGTSYLPAGAAQAHAAHASGQLSGIYNKDPPLRRSDVAQGEGAPALPQLRIFIAQKFRDLMLRFAPGAFRVVIAQGRFGGNDMSRVLLAGSVYFLMLFALGFAFGTIRVVLLAPHLGQVAATLSEIPVMLVAAVVSCRWALGHWQVSRAKIIRWAMVGWFLILLFGFETLLGAALFGRTASEQWAALGTPAGLLGLTGQIIAALMPVLVRTREGS
jgi:hypothetical protein